MKCPNTETPKKKITNTPVPLFGQKGSVVATNGTEYILPTITPHKGQEKDKQPPRNAKKATQRSRNW